MNGFYNKNPQVCHRSDLHHFRRMQDRFNPERVWLRRVSKGDIVRLQNQIITKWKIVEEAPGVFYLGIITARCNFVNPRKTLIYVVAPSKNPQNPHFDLYRIKDTTNVNKIVDIFKVTGIVRPIRR